MASKTELRPARKHYIDNLRWALIMILVPFHTAMAWNSWGEGNYIWISGSRFASTFITLISPWFMPLMFVLAGVSARYALRKRSFPEFAKERAMKLFVPLLLGLLTVVPFMTYVADRFNNGYKGGFFEHYAIFFSRVTDFTGYDGVFTPAHLWFLLYLFVISMISLGIIALQRRFAPKFSLHNAGWLWILLPAIAVPLASLILDIGGKSLGGFLLLYLLGYYLLAEEEVITRIARYRFLLAGIATVFCVFFVVLFIWIDGTPDLVWELPMHFASWFGILSLLGLGKFYFDFDNRVTRYLSSRSFLFYIFHFGWLIAIQYFVSSVTSNVAIIALTSVVGGYILTFLWCEILLLLGKALRKVFSRETR